MMKKYFSLILLFATNIFFAQAQYGTNWMNQVKSWDVQLTVKYKDSANPGNFTTIEFTAKGTITNEMMPAGSRMTWPMAADPMQMKTVIAKGSFTKKVTEDMPEPNRVDDYSCSAAINEKILGGLGTTFNDKYVINLQMPLIPGLTCSGKGAPSSEDGLKSVYRDSGIEPPDPSVLMGDCGPNRHTLSGTKNYTTEAGAKVFISWVYTPLSSN